MVDSEFFIKKFKIISFFLQIFRFNNRKRNLLESNNRLKIELFDFINLSKPIDYSYESIIIENNLYGNFKILDSFPKFNKKEVQIEHGFIFGSLVQKYSILGWQKFIFTFSDYRKQYLESKTNKKIICIGPYIHYYKGILNISEFNNLKKKIGKTLLIMPSHSIMEVDQKFNHCEFINNIEKFAINYDTVLICMYWADIQKNEHEIYERLICNSKIKITCAGHKNDRYFMNRLRTIFELSDFVFTNSVGTHVGYSIYFDKPLFILRQEIDFNYLNIGEINQRDLNDVDSLNFIKEEIYELFNDKNVTRVKSKQFNYISELFGFKYLKYDE